MKIMIDLNVLLDFAQKRKPFYRYSSIVISEVLKNRVIGVIPSHAVTTIHYLITRLNNKQNANEFTDWLLSKFDIIPSDKTIFKKARQLKVNDFEDAVVISLAEKSGCDFIISRNITDFKNSSVPAITPESFVCKYVSVD